MMYDDLGIVNLWAPPFPAPAIGERKMAGTAQIRLTVGVDPDSWGGDTTEEEGIVYAERYAERLRVALAEHYPDAQIAVDTGNEERVYIHVPSAEPDYPGASDISAEDAIREHLAYLLDDVFAEFCQADFDEPQTKGQET